MRILLLLVAGLLSLGILYLSWLALSGGLTLFVYTLAISAIAVFLVFALFHMIYLYLQQRRK